MNTPVSPQKPCFLSQIVVSQIVALGLLLVLIPLNALAQGPFQEQGGQVVFEAESYDAKIDRSAHSWTESATPAGASGDVAMCALPDDRTLIKQKNAPTQSPELGFNVAFTTTGTYYVWLRVWAPDSKGNSAHAGLAGALSRGSKIETLVFGSWQWTNTRINGTRARLTVTSGGVQVVNVWMREDGVCVDKVLLTTDAGFVPSGQGPAESPRSGALPRVVSSEPVESVSEVPAEYVLEAAYPNPFNPQTTIRFGVSEVAYVKLVVYDVLGRQVRVLVDGTREAGTYEVVFEAGGLPSGLYVYRLETPQGSFVQMMHLVK